MIQPYSESVVGNIDSIFVMVIKSGADLESAILEAAEREGITCGVILSGVGSIDKVALANPRKTHSGALSLSYMKMQGRVELLSLQGNISRGIPITQPTAEMREDSINVHLHAMVSDVDGRVFGGALHSGNVVGRQVELIVASIGGVDMKRVPDPVSKRAMIVLKSL
ncbi:PPC domain-containing DNA-binding protein [Thermodesulfobacteriota bacterium]